MSDLALCRGGEILILTLLETLSEVVFKDFDL